MQNDCKIRLSNIYKKLSAIDLYYIILEKQMRCTLQKHKYSSALRHMTSDDSQNNTQFINAKDKKSPAISIINIDTYKKDQTKKDKNLRRINPLTTFNVPYTKHQSKIFKFLLESNSLREEAKNQSLKFSERVDSSSQKRHSQYSERAINEQKILKKIQGSKHEKLIQMNKKYKLNKNQLELLKKKSQQNLIENIEILRKREQILACQQDQPILFDVSVKHNRKSSTEGSYRQDLFSLQNIENFHRFKKQEATLRLKQNVKNKLSRRNMYHALKQKNEAFNQIKVKIKKLSNKELIAETSYPQNLSYSLPHYGQNHSPIKKFVESYSKGYTLPFFERISKLKIQSRAAQIFCDFSKIKLQQKNSNLLRTQNLFKIESKSFSLDKYEMNNPEKQCRLEVKKQQMLNISRKQRDSRGRKDLMNQKTKNEGLNMFRLLTPWHNDYPQ